MTYNYEKRASAMNGIKQILTDLVETEQGSLSPESHMKAMVKALGGIFGDITEHCPVEAHRLAATVLDDVNYATAAKPLHEFVRIEDMHDEDCILMSEQDYENTPKKEWEDCFDSFSDFEYAVNDLIAELLIDDSDSAPTLIVHAESGTILSKVWMKDGQIWGRDIDSEADYKIIHYSEAF